MKRKIKVSSDIVGGKITPYPYHVSFRDISNFAAAINDENPVYYDTLKVNEIVAHPVFPVKPAWQIVHHIDTLLDVEFPTELLNNMMHQSEYIEIFHPVKPDDDLLILGELVALVPHKLGIKLTLKFDYFDVNEQPVVTEYVGGMIFGAKCADSGKAIADLPIVERIDTVEPVSKLPKIPISRLACYHYDGCADISYPIHTNPKYAKSKGLPDIVMQGSATLAIAVSAFVKNELENNPANVKIVSGKFTDIVVPPNILTVRVLKRTKNEIYFDICEKQGEVVLRGGYIKII